jgi:DNA (cytosine-5)-methyltransferase 1
MKTMETIDITKMNKTQLLNKCKELGIKNYSSKNKPQLVELILQENIVIPVQNLVQGQEQLVQDPLTTTPTTPTSPTTPTTQQHYPPGTQEDYNSFSSRNLMMEKGNELEFPEGQGVGKGEPGVPPTTQLKFIDLFCGIGGFHQALKRINNTQCVLACDIDNDCREIYKLNYDINPVEDVKKINENTMTDFDIICAGFPCQAFSNGGKKKCFEDERGLLFDEIMRIAKVKKPKFMFLENVKHILKVSNGEVIEYIKKRIANLGYHLQLFQISPHNYGIPQQRERVYFVCVRNDIYNGTDVVLTSPTTTKNTTIKFQNYLDKKCDIDPKYFIKGDILKVLETWDEVIKQMEVGEKMSPTILINDAFQTYTEEEFNSFPAWKKDYITKNKPLIEKYRPMFLEWYNQNSDILKKREIYGKLEWQTGPIKPQDSIFNHFIQVRQSGIRVKKSNYFPTLVAISQIPIYGKEQRYITPRECARLQSFPDTFKLSPDDKKSYKQLGNSVNVDNVYTVISSTLSHYN